MIKYDEFALECFKEEFEEEIESGEIELEKYKIAVCSTRRSPTVEWEMSLTLIDIIETEIYNYQDEKILLICPDDPNKAYEVFEALRGETLEEIINYTDYDTDLVDKKLYEIKKGEVDFFLTSNEFCCL